VLLSLKRLCEPLQHQRSRFVCSRYAEYLPPLNVSNRFQHPTATHGSALPGISLNQFARAAPERIAERTRRTFLGQSKNVLKALKQRPIPAM
jgi:hypothetical protein